MRRLLLIVGLVAASSVSWTPSLPPLPTIIWNTARCTWYSLPHRFTANGERMNPNAMTAAHKTLPFGTLVEAVSQETGQKVLVKITDRGPYCDEDPARQFDLTPAAFKALGHSLKQGVANVHFRIVYRPDREDHNS